VVEGAVHRDRQVNLRIRLLSITVLWALRKSGWILWLEKRVLRVLWARLVRLGSRVSPAQKVLKARRVPRVRRARRALLGPLERLVLRGRRVSRVFRGLPVHRATRGLLARKEKLAHRDQKAQRDHKGPRVLPDRKV
jgi:hypothetical protein